MDSYQSLKRCCEQWSTYPCNLLRPDQRRNVLENYHLILDGSEIRLFQASTEDIRILEPSDSPNGYIEQIFTSPFGLRKHLEQNRKDPAFSLIFVQSDNVRTPLNCSRESFAFLSSFYQIPAYFLDFVSSFGYSAERQDYHMTGFNSYDTLEPSTSNALEIRQLGRSGSEHVVQYMLRSVEKLTDSSSNTNWDVHQMAVHHRYDFVYGKALWLNIKTNNIISERIKEAMAEDPMLNFALSKGLSGSFTATLRTHLIHLEWCDNSWREYICDVEGEIRKTVKGIKALQTSDRPDIHCSLLEGVVINEMEAKVMETDDPQRSVPRRLTKELEDLTNLENLPFEEAEKLDAIRERLENSLLVLQLNIQTLQDISDHYENLANRESLPSEVMKGSFFSDLDSFSQRVGRIRKNLEIRVTQVNSLISWLRKKQQLFEGLLRQRSVQASCFLTKTSHFHLDRMEQIAHMTREETASMHVITFVTMVFLPVSFLASFCVVGFYSIDQSRSVLGGTSLALVFPCEF
ncbi:hypothetical protein FOVG_16812 [Fusarium oxysporum f. sp. pisi HDV247]|uniref:CorA-like transporter domain-containing protein n=1 Tax=Fusarium oxysporum f. sp. pisi HDV247 TaxID=1080344 RepID=W9NGX9_FUSOX|nr:hypothetical protein FOVG_16812 [Fusarium oxysporum f. sp. pisi HDV247]WKT40126.1 hypothetical protein QSH57_001945 [Fusarium oxysporum f. sp. vasinfectum]